MDETVRILAQQALGLYDRLLAERPGETHQPLSDAMRTVVRLRDALVTRRRGGDPSPELQEQLAQTNVIASLAFSCQFPIAGVKWQRMETTRDALRRFVNGP